MGLAVLIIGASIMAFVAYQKGFNIWAWILAAGLLGLIVLLTLPSAKAPNLDEETIQKRVQKGNKIGSILSAVAIVLGVFMAYYMAKHGQLQ